MSISLSRRAPRRFWTWGQSDAELSANELANLKFMVEQLGGQFEVRPVPRTEEFALRSPRIAPSSALAAMSSSALAAWRGIKHCAKDAVICRGGTITHHHAVGRGHPSGYDAEVPDLYRQMLGAAKQVVDPQGLPNPGVRLYPLGRLPMSVVTSAK